ncbi:hypothetical protein GGX14DRAFT_571823 [Mycena pura]|uniref:Chromo domain-containing protein n=1 Tax=Mycena pura TaxID=153505 RepID=A0AAD6V239_9AGAR|nr:hypothetical protein GGX14DRAFT_571823 [Mycena pura]
MPSAPFTSTKNKRKTPDLSETEEDDEEQEEDSQMDYEVEDILDTRLAESGEQQWLVKWKGYDTSHNDWLNKDALAILPLAQSLAQSIAPNPLVARLYVIRAHKLLLNMVKKYANAEQTQAPANSAITAVKAVAMAVALQDSPAVKPSSG